MVYETKQPHPIDVAVGAKVRRARVAREMSQGALADQIGVTFQQVQKYENGSNRISASKLVEIADTLRVTPMSFFEGLGAHAGCRSPADPPALAEELLSIFCGLPEPLRASLLQVARSLAQTISPRSARSPSGRDHNEEAHSGSLER